MHLLSHILFLFCSYIFALSLHWATVFAKIFLISCWNSPNLVDKLSFDIYLLITVHFCFPNLNKKIFVMISALPVLILFLFSSKSHCSFKIVLRKKRVYCLLFVMFHQYLFFSCSIIWPVFTRSLRTIIAYIESKNFIPFLSLKYIYFLAFQTSF